MNIATGNSQHQLIETHQITENQGISCIFCTHKILSHLETLDKDGMDTT